MAPAPLSGRKQAWGGALDVFKECGLPAGAKVRNLGLGFTLPEKPTSEQWNIPEIMNQVQEYVFQRRLRVKDSFRDYDQLHCGRCTRQQFMRGVNNTVPTLIKAQLEALADHYTEEGPHVCRPQVVAYAKFVKNVEEVFTIAHLETQPTRFVPRAGASLQQAFRPRSVGVVNEEARVLEILKKISLLCKTRGIIFLSCFQDSDRSDATSLTTPRYSGKATPAQFAKHFPLISDFSSSDLKLLMKRYTTPSGDINYQALDRDVQEASKEVPAPTHPNENTQILSSAQSALTTPRIGKVVSSERRRRELALKETLESVDIMEKMRAVVSERRLRLSDCFLDFDKLRKGVCTMTQLKTVFTVLGIEFGPDDFKNLAELYCDEDGMFRYRELSAAVCEVGALNINSWDMELPPTPAPMSARGDTSRPGTSGSRIRYKAPVQDPSRLAELEIRIRNRAETRSLDLKRCFQDFDRTCRGRVTRTQFARIMDMLQCELSPADTEMVCQAYCDSNNGEEFNYNDFVACIKTRDTMETTLAPLYSSRRSKYFDRSGECISPCIQLDQLDSFLNTSLSKTGQGLWSRGGSR